jgi:carboxypeptidase C (cathepsin A)
LEDTQEEKPSEPHHSEANAAGIKLDVEQRPDGSTVATVALPAGYRPHPEPEPQPVITHHQVKVNGKTIRYTVTTGMMPLRNDIGEIEANLFFVAYTRDGAGAPANRPLMFSFNGGPGSSSVWLHLGALGPRRVKMREDGSLPPPPYQLVENDQTWLDETDLVFIDPVGTGYSRATKPELGKKFWGLKGDLESVGEFIRLYLTRHRRWASPLFLVGESYGTTRAAGLAGSLIDKGIAFNGVLLVSTVLNFQTLHFTTGNDLPYHMFLPSFTATAWYHGRLGAELQQDLATTLSEVEEWVSTEYITALAKGDAIPESERAEVVRRLARYTGLSERYIAQSNLRPEIHRFCKELLRDDRKTVGRLDSRLTGPSGPEHAEQPDFDPSMSTIRPPYTAMLNHYVRGDLGYENDNEYFILGGGIKDPWEWDTEGQGFTDTSDALRLAFAKNPHMKLFVAYGYYDLATPYFAAKYTLSHMGLDACFRDSIVLAGYESGHMMYIHEGSLVKLKEDMSDFMRLALGKGEA